MIKNKIQRIMEEIEKKSPKISDTIPITVYDFLNPKNLNSK